MKKFYSLALLGAFLLLCCSPLSAQNSINQHNVSEELVKYVPNVLYWQVNKGVNVPVFENIDDVRNSELNKVDDLASVISSFNVTRIEQAFSFWKGEDGLSRTYKVYFAENRNAEGLVEALNRLSATTYSEKIPAMETSVVPNDPDYSLQWYLPQINAEDAWDTNDCGGSNVVIAIVDDAVLTTHEDLASKITGGFDVADNDANPNPPSSVSNPYFSHGTHVAGIAGAATNNAIGMASIGHHSMIMPIKTKSDANTSPGGLDNPYAGVLYAIGQGVDVINMSWGGYGYSATQADVISQAVNAGIVCVAAAGNDNAPFAAYPAAYPNVIGVGATNSSDQKASFSNHGYGVDVMAPGVGIYSSVATGISDYDSWSGTSMASPIVAGLAALYLCEHGGDPNTNPNTLTLCLMDSALDIDGNNPGFEGALGSGLIQADAALDCAPSTENDCVPGLCELVPNGDFETPTLASLTTYDYSNPFSNDQVCGWNRLRSSPHIVHHDVDQENYAILYVGTPSSSGNEDYEIIATDALNLISGRTYTVEYDYYTANQTVDSLVIGLTNSLNSYTNADPPPPYILIDAQTNISPDITGINIWDDSTQPSAGDLHHVSLTACFTAPADTTFNHLMIYARQANGGHAGVYVDNVSLRPCLDINAYAVQDTICYGSCTELITEVDGGDYVIWEPAYGLDDPNSYNPTACPDETTTYTVTVYDEESGCTTSADVTIVVVPCEPPECDDIITVEGICTPDGILLTAYINGVVIDPSATNPTYNITWDGTTVDYVNDNPVLYPSGEAYTLKVAVIYNTDPLICCHYEYDLVAEGELDISIDTPQETICQFTCTELSVNAPAGSVISWSPATGLDDPSSANPIACPLETTTYTVLVYDPETECYGKDEVTIVVDEKCDCEEAKVEVVQECVGYEVITKVLINGVAIDPSGLSWIDINWDVLNGTTGDIVDANCVSLPIGTEFEVHVTYGIDLNNPSECCHHYIKGEVKDLECVNCEFSLQETCKGDDVCITMVNAAGDPIVPGTFGDYTFQIWWDYNQTIYVNQNPFCIPAGSTYGATLRIYKKDKLFCENSIKDYKAECCKETKYCCTKFNPSGVVQTYTVEEDIVVSWDPNGATTYEIDIVHNYSGCAPSTCHFEVDGGTTYISLADAGCFFTCQNYTITVTAICADGTKYSVTLPTIFTHPKEGYCLACEKPDDGYADQIGAEDGGGSDEEDGKGKASIDTNIQTDITLYPNPATNLLNINFGAIHTTSTVEIFDMAGKRLQLVEANDSQSSIIDVTELPATVYIAKVTLDNQDAVYIKFAIVK